MMFTKVKSASHCDVATVIFFHLRKLAVLFFELASRTMLELMVKGMTWKSIMWLLEVMISNEHP